jgi:hypothetical protein
MPPAITARTDRRPRNALRRSNERITSTRNPPTTQRPDRIIHGSKSPTIAPSAISHKVYAPAVTQSTHHGRAAPRLHHHLSLPRGPRSDNLLSAPTPRGIAAGALRARRSDLSGPLPVYTPPSGVSLRKRQSDISLRTRRSDISLRTGLSGVSLRAPRSVASQRAPRALNRGRHDPAPDQALQIPASAEEIETEELRAIKFVIYPFAPLTPDISNKK